MNSIESERDSASTARRERAEKSMRAGAWGFGDELRWARLATGDYPDSPVGNEVSRGFLYGYLAGAREEAEIKDAEIAQLRERISRYERTQVDWPFAEGEYRAEIAQKDADIAALRERLATYQRALLWCYGWMMDGMTAKFAKAIDNDEKYRKVKSLVGEASDEVEP